MNLSCAYFSCLRRHSAFSREFVIKIFCFAICIALHFHRIFTMLTICHYYSIHESPSDRTVYTQGGVVTWQEKAAPHGKLSRKSLLKLPFLCTPSNHKDH